MASGKAVRVIVRLLPSLGAFVWLLWYCTLAEWDNVVTPNWHWLLLAAGMATVNVWWLTRKKRGKALTIKKEEECMKIAPIRLNLTFYSSQCLPTGKLVQ